MSKQIKRYYSNGIDLTNILFTEFETTEYDQDVNQQILQAIEKHGLKGDLTFEIEENVEQEPSAQFVESRRGKTILLYNNHRYRKAYKSKMRGTRWNCSVKNDCTAYVYLNDDDEIVLSNEEHNHQRQGEGVDAPDENDTAVVITSRKGKEMLLFRKYTYRKQYMTLDKARWVCSTLKNCHACVFTDHDNVITSASEQHCHDPPKYYLKPKHVLQALREPLILETD